MENTQRRRFLATLNSLSDRRLKRSTFFCAGLLFLLIFWYPWETPDYLKTWESRQGDTYILMPDTPSYIAFRAWKNPWQSVRPLGYPLFLYPFLRHDRQPFMRALHEAGRSGFQNWFDDDEPIYTIPKKLGIDRKFEAVALVQRVILALGIALFYLSLSQWFGEIFALVALLAALSLSPPPPPQAIMTEPLSCALTWLCGAFLLWAPASGRRGLCFALACLCAGVSFLIRPQTLSLTGLCSLLFLYEVFIAGRKHLITSFFKQALVFSPLLIAYGYIAWLSVTGGNLFLHTMPEVHYLTVYYYADAEDARHMPTERARKFIEWYSQQKDGLVQRIPISDEASPPKREHTIGATILHSFDEGGVWKHFADVDGIGNLGRIGRSVFARELLAGLHPRHSGELLAARWEHFISAFGYYDDVYRLAPFPRATFALNILALALSLGAIAVCASYRWPLVIMLGIHIMAVLAASLGNVILQRYVEPTVPFLFLTAFSSCLALGEKLYARWRGAGAGKNGNSFISFLIKKCPKTLCALEGILLIIVCAGFLDFSVQGTLLAPIKNTHHSTQQKLRGWDDERLERKSQETDMEYATRMNVVVGSAFYHCYYDTRENIFEVVASFLTPTWKANGFLQPSRNCGFCHQAAYILARVLNAQGIEAYPLGMNGHVCVLMKNGDIQYIFDPDFVVGPMLYQDDMTFYIPELYENQQSNSGLYRAFATNTDDKPYWNMKYLNESEAEQDRILKTVKGIWYLSIVFLILNTLLILRKLRASKP